MIFTGTTQRARHRGPNMSSILLRAGPLLAALMLSFAAPAGIGHAAPAHRGRWLLSAGRDRSRPSGRNPVYGRGLFEFLPGGGVRLRHGRRRGALLFGRRFRDGGSS